MFKQKNYLALGAVVLVAVVLLSLPTRATSRLKLAVSSWFLPLFGLAGAGQQLPADLADSLLPRRELLHQIDVLRRENQQLRSQAVQGAAIARENDQLHALLGWKQTKPWKLKLANVVMRDPANWWRTVQIDLGSRDGIQTNQPVLTNDGLVGRVSAVSYLNATVVLIGDRDCRVSALVDNTTHDVGVLSASGPLDNSFVQLSYLASTANLKAGQDVSTSGLGGVFPKGIPIGKIVDTQTVEYGLATEARVKLNANLGALEQVWVLIQ
ncbi:MAG TPA: rod shape-determining protein MreC [Candidatus Acidoferrales bacterium]|jgi:rod shape-determining protein MreC|nr:rod shape-determining protein MreC [Candidatus Acidoferrales bacterium]